MSSEDIEPRSSPPPSSLVVDEVCKALDDYDPMKQDYLNPQFNSYDGVEPAPGIKTDPTYNISKAVVRLFIDQIPFSLDNTGLKNLFSKHGTVLESKIFRRSARDTRCGIVSFGSRAEASKAIDEIHQMEPFFLRVFFQKPLEDETPTQDDIEAEKIYLKREKLMQEFEEDRGIHWDHLPILSEGPNLRLQSIIQEELKTLSSPWINPIFRSSDDSSLYSLSSKCQFERKSDYLKAQMKIKGTVEVPLVDEEVMNDDIYEIGSFFGAPIPFHKISDYIKKKNISPDPILVKTKNPIPSVSLPGGQSSEVFIRVFANGPEMNMFVIKDPFVCKNIRSKLTYVLGEPGRSTRATFSGSLSALQLKRDKFWYRSEKAGPNIFFLLDFGKYVKEEEVEAFADIPDEFLQNIPGQAISANFFDDIKFSVEGKVLKEVLLLFKNKKVRVQPMGLHKNGQVLLRFEGAKGPNGKDLLEYLLEEGYVYRVSPPLQLGVDYDLYDILHQHQKTESKKLSTEDVVFIVDFLDSTNEIIVVEQNSIEERNLFQEKLQEGKNCKSMDPSFVVENRIVKYERPQDQMFYRGKILAIDSQREKVRLFLVDFGYLCLAQFDELYPLDKDYVNLPFYANVLTLKDVERIFLFDPEVFLRTRRLLPILSVPLVIQSLCKNGEFTILRHPTGKTVNDIIQEKLTSDDSHLCGAVEGQGRLNSFNYNQCLISELTSLPNVLMEALLLHIESPTEIFATPVYSLPLYSDFVRQTQAYCSITSEPTFYKPDINKVYLVKSSQDGSWYRGVNLDKDNHIFFADVGFIEKRSPFDIQAIDESLMKYPFLSNHCVYKGFEDLEWNYEERDFSFLKNLVYTKASIRVLQVRDCNFVIDIPSIDEEMSLLRERILSEKP